MVSSKIQERFWWFILLVAGSASMAQVFTIVSTTSPHEASSTELWTFYVLLDMSLCTLLCVLWHIVRSLWNTRQMKRTRLRVSLRQAFLFSSVTVISLFLNSLGLFQWFDLVPFLIACILIEFYFQADKRSPTTHHDL